MFLLHTAAGICTGTKARRVQIASMAMWIGRATDRLSRQENLRNEDNECMVASTYLAKTHKFVVYVIPKLSRKPRLEVKSTKYQTEGILDNTGNCLLRLFFLSFFCCCRGMPT